MKTYKEYRPTAMDPRGLGLPDRQDWLVAPVSRTRDSGCREKSNFVTCLKRLGWESETVEVHRFGHWGPGWFEVILIDPRDETRVREAEEIEGTLANYPVLDDHDLSEREEEVKTSVWEGMRLKERVEVCKRFRVSIFAARRDYPPDDPSGGLGNYLLGG